MMKNDDVNVDVPRVIRGTAQLPGPRRRYSRTQCHVRRQCDEPWWEGGRSELICDDNDDGSTSMIRLSKRKIVAVFVDAIDDLWCCVASCDGGHISVQ